MLLASDQPSVDEFSRVTGWRLEPEGACRGDVCVPLPSGAVTGHSADRVVDLVEVAERLGMGIARDEDTGLIGLGPATLGGRALATTEAPDLELPDFDGNPFRLRSLRGTKVVLVAWAPY